MDEEQLTQQLAMMMNDTVKKPPDQKVVEQVAAVFEVILQEAKRLKPSHPVVSTMQPFGRSQMGQVMGTYGDLHVLASQLYRVFS